MLISCILWCMHSLITLGTVINAYFLRRKIVRNLLGKHYQVLSSMKTDSCMLMTFPDLAEFVFRSISLPKASYHLSNFQVAWLCLHLLCISCLYLSNDRSLLFIHADLLPPLQGIFLPVQSETSSIPFPPFLRCPSFAWWEGGTILGPSTLPVRWTEGAFAWGMVECSSSRKSLPQSPWQLLVFPPHLSTLPVGWAHGEPDGISHSWSLCCPRGAGTNPATPCSPRPGALRALVIAASGSHLWAVCRERNFCLSEHHTGALSTRRMTTKWANCLSW